MLTQNWSSLLVAFLILNFLQISLCIKNALISNRYILLLAPGTWSQVFCDEMGFCAIKIRWYFIFLCYATRFTIFYRRKLPLTALHISFYHFWRSTMDCKTPYLRYACYRVYYIVNYQSLFSVLILASVGLARTWSVFLAVLNLFLTRDFE